MLVAVVTDRKIAYLYLSELKSPRALSALKRMLPLRVKLHASGELLMISLDLSVAPEGHRTVFCKGDVAYWPPAATIIIPTSAPCVHLASPASYLGSVVKGLEELIRVGRRGEEVTLLTTDWEDVEGSFTDT
ncbi:MAG: hypothetical protein NZ954_04005 [Thermofilaceae archaeon]|nr:hypothetical protein [Thermofilaceae archaeon]MCX8180822.1 hypothetical protein [Thermofilaceae archaeon]MDW8004608.1 cyclophilin-like family protein [Thermofilaceae archaeon]